LTIGATRDWTGLTTGATKDWTGLTTGANNGCAGARIGSKGCAGAFDWTGVDADDGKALETALLTKTVTRLGPPQIVLSAPVHADEHERSATGIGVYAKVLPHLQVEPPINPAYM
jgi:hypothetical protein